MKQRILHLPLLLVLLVLAACGNNSQQAQPSGAVSGAATNSAAASMSPSAAAPSAAATQASAAGGSPDASVAASAAASATTVAEASPSVEATAGPGEFINPVINQDFPDPDVLKVGDTYYAYATNAGGTNVQTAKSSDLVQWEMLGEALPALPGWATGGFTWAPEVTTTADGKGYVMYFTARDTASNLQCIGAATSDKPEGPFQSTAEKAFICPTKEGGAIDAGSFVDEDGSRYVLWKNDGNCCGLPTRLYIQKSSADGLILESEPKALVENDQIWEGQVTEAPTLWKRNGKYYLLYSANNYAGLDYTVGYAVSDKIDGPYTKPPENPILRTDLKTAAAFGPGGQDIVVDKDGDTWLMYHSWDSTVTKRVVLLDEVVWEGDALVVKGPDKVPQPLP